uniref:Uncharacterized protein n=1 Tax=Rhizophora mucronata TaxID=61149 RepID=A0A2P2KMP2_RHIMU
MKLRSVLLVVILASLDLLTCPFVNKARRVEIGRATGHTSSWFG